MEVLVNVDSIVAIKLVEKIKTNTYTWLPKSPDKKYLFGLIKKNDGCPEGFYEYGMYFKDSWSSFGGLVSAEYITDRGYLIDEETKIVYVKPYIEIRLLNGDHTTKRFSTTLEANEYISKLELLTSNKFERIKV